MVEEKTKHENVESSGESDVKEEIAKIKEKISEDKDKVTFLESRLKDTKVDKNLQKMKKGSRKNQLILAIVAVFGMLYATFVVDTPVIPVVYGLEPIKFLFIISIILSLFVTFVYKFMTDQVLMRELKKELKKYQRLMKETRKDPIKMNELSKKSMEVNMKYMRQSLKPMIITIVPFFLIFGWLRGQFDGTIIFTLPIWPHTLGWIGTYIIFSMITTSLFRKLMKVA